MSLSPTKQLILETMWDLNRPAKAAEVAKAIGVSFPAVMMHMIGLERSHYINGKRGLYELTEEGKSVIDPLHQRNSERLYQEMQKASNLELAGRYEEAAKIYESLKMYEKAGEVRKMAKTQYVISTSFRFEKGGTIIISCPHCGASQPAESKSSQISCKYCGKSYVVPKKILDMI